jgi:ketol-acid reductoisomerase
MVDEMRGMTEMAQKVSNLSQFGNLSVNAFVYSIVFKYEL